jgi:hypothetical protein
MAYNSSSSEGRVFGSHIIYGGQYVPLSVFANAFGYNTWVDYIKENPVINGKVAIPEGKAIASRPHANPVNRQSGANLNIPDEWAARRAEERGDTRGRWIKDDPLRPDDRTDSQFGGVRVRPRSEDVRRPNPSGQQEPVYDIDPPVQQESSRRIDPIRKGDPRWIDPPGPPGGKMEEMPKIIQDPKTGGYRLFSPTPKLDIRSMHLQRLQSDSLSGGNITDVYKNYLRRKPNAQ